MESNTWAVPLAEGMVAGCFKNCQHCDFGPPKGMNNFEWKRPS